MDIGPNSTDRSSTGAIELKVSSRFYEALRTQWQDVKLQKHQYSNVKINKECASEELCI